MTREKKPDPLKPPRKPDPPFDAIRSLENELSVQMAWRNKLADMGDQYRADQIEKDIRKIQEHIDRRLQERGLSARYAGGGAVAWDGSL